ncbi:HI0074 family nucleotidyltransferase substrate-binding subunit [Effusibacillus lacus]|uniref:Nucleotidyltransferase n=1 Tax=Effusibacillus lacus TaxID=1348429 RepID=A0A292YLK8_9BACL|nr:HI0074 family nucleotidyltransferase substrate-binding subunit [Effusibacillus lacus]TCS74175.1 nucleotidyltransferase substrate binding protein (TIGR01987 family) [Effusibacillus lacus]GAX90828.1 nucleotidyltransferase [Effusibacillus lacus]
MERMEQRLKVSYRALTTLDEVLSIPNPSRIERDASIQRFEYTFEAIWKTVKQYLLEYEGMDIGSPKGVVRASLSVGLLDAEEATLALEMVDDRNLSVHTYNEALADMIFGRLPKYASLMKKWLDEVSGRKR